MCLQNVVTTGDKKEMVKRYTDIRSSHKDVKNKSYMDRSYMCVLVSVELSFHWEEIENYRHGRLELHDGTTPSVSQPVSERLACRIDEANTDNT